LHTKASKASAVAADARDLAYVLVVVGNVIQDFLAKDDKLNLPEDRP
jgi:hypothetical protein